MANPTAKLGRLLFVKQHAAHSHRNITGSQYPWIHKPGGGIYVQEGLEPGSPVREVLQNRLGPGHVRGIGLWWDGSRVVFGYARQPNWPPSWDSGSENYAFELRGHKEPAQLFEIGIDGDDLRQLTDHPQWSDLEPTYCADGSIVFASDRSGRSSECGQFSADHTVVNLYRIDANGGNLRRINDNKDIDRHPHSLDNGLIAYTRWEYQERHFMEVHSIWTVRPNGTMADALFKQHLRAPFGLRDTRSVPDSPLLVPIATGHHTFAYGPLVLVDPRGGINAADGIRIVTPFSAPEEGGMAGKPVEQRGVPDRGDLYHGPWALSETCFLASFSHARPPSSIAIGTNSSGFAVYFQALDENLMEVRRMRSHVTFQAGEARGCVGCHESQSHAPPKTADLALALRRPPDAPDSPPWGTERLLGYEWLVQPILDRHCAECHGQTDPEGGIDLSATRAGDGFVQSFRTLFSRRGESNKEYPPLVSVSDRFDNAAVTAPMQFGSHCSRLVIVLCEDTLHRRQVKLSANEWWTLVTWVDANAPYHDGFLNKRPAGGGPPHRELPCT